MGDQEQSGRPAPVFSIFDNVGSYVPTAVREKIRAGGFFFDILCINYKEPTQQDYSA